MMYICKMSKLMINTLNLGGVVFLEAEDKEEDLVVKEAKSFVITMDNLDIFLEIALILHRHVHIANHWITLLKNVHN